MINIKKSFLNYITLFLIQIIFPVICFKVINNNPLKQLYLQVISLKINNLHLMASSIPITYQYFAQSYGFHNNFYLISYVLNNS